MAITNKEKIVWTVIVTVILLFLMLLIFYLFKTDLDASQNENLNKAITKAIKKKEHKIYMPEDYNVNFSFRDGVWEATAFARDQDLILLAKKHKIEKLNIKNSELTDVAYQYLQNEPITQLHLFRPFLKSKELVAISNIGTLESLVLRNNPLINDKMLVHLTGPAGLKKLVVRDTHVADDGLVHISKTFPDLEELDLRKCRGVTARGIIALQKLEKLEKLNLNNIALTKKALIEVAKIDSIHNLSLVACTIDDAKLKGLVRSKATSLVLSENPVTARSLNTTLSKMKLKRLVLKVCDKLKKADLEKFINSHPKVKVTWTARVEPKEDSDLLMY